eukprot:ctg_392.g245
MTAVVSHPGLVRLFRVVLALLAGVHHPASLSGARPGCCVPRLCGHRGCLSAAGRQDPHYRVRGQRRRQCGQHAHRAATTGRADALGGQTGGGPDRFEHAGRAAGRGYRHAVCAGATRHGITLHVRHRGLAERHAHLYSHASIGGGAGGGSAWRRPGRGAAAGGGSAAFGFAVHAGGHRPGTTGQSARHTHRIGRRKAATTRGSVVAVGGLYRHQCDVSAAVWFVARAARRQTAVRHQRNDGHVGGGSGAMGDQHTRQERFGDGAQRASGRSAAHCGKWCAGDGDARHRTVIERLSAV